MNWGIATRSGAIPLDRSTPTPSAVSGGVSSIVFAATDTDSSSISGGASYTFTLTVPSAAGQGRLVIVGGIGGAVASVDFTAVTIDGQTATRVGTVSKGADDGSNVCAFLTCYRAPGTSGTNINVVATGASGPTIFGGYCALWTLNDTATLIGLTNAATNDPTLNTNTTAGGIAAAAVMGYTGSSPTVVWTGLTEDFDTVRVFGDEVFSGASANIASAGTPRAISADLTPNLSASIASICVSFKPAPSSNDADTDAWVAAVVTAGGTVSAGRTTAVNNFIVGLKADGLWTKLDRYFLFASEGSPQATLVDIRNLQPALAVNSPTLGSTGYTTNGSNSYIDLKTPQTGGTLYTLNSAHASVWSSGAAPVWALIGHYVAGGALELGYYSGQWQWSQGPNENGPVVATGVSTYTGLGLLSRTASNARAFYYNGASISSDALASSAVATQDIFVGGVAYLGGLINATTGTFASASVGAGLTATDATNFYNRQRTLMTACGVP